MLVEVELVVVGCTNVLSVTTEPLELEELDSPPLEYHPLFCINGYHPLSSAKAGDEKRNKAISRAVILRNIIPPKYIFHESSLLGVLP